MERRVTEVSGQSALQATQLLAIVARRCYMPFEETVMGDLARVEIDRDVADAAAERAAKEGLTVTAYISLLLRRSFERVPGEESVLVYDHVQDGGEFRVDREADEDDESYERRSVLYGSLFGRS
jgi:hypothetical protein